ncbi:bifunctional diaminohydroxyphosphoribosylaminopyrimidine deaminase/5-amino-6-(5-phosphoribosylamino)uracil reductase RibD [Candidatus Peregrinibacteria bacterium]|nr:bifunctional diaminohydroxyphosphoribosylaminopyrimidine deaminase/5-amino-6-(5-phosphoribosylamino)uracil reductase RibD [Candidatus Peregrinibacteria bacterium]
MSKTFMMRAIELARFGMGKTSPNPCVGAVIVKGGFVVAEGWHRKAGEKHAEIVAIDSLMKKSGIKTVDIDPALFSNADLYVTLEPCCHFGKTSPCASKVIKARFKNVFIGMKDPFSKVNGKGIWAMKRAGIKVEVVKPDCDLAFEVRSLNQPFIKWAQMGMPYVVLKAGMTLDGKTATRYGESKWITSEAARKDARNLRNLFDAVLVGSGTVKADNPRLGEKLRIVVDGNLSCDPKSQVFRDENCFVACTSCAPLANRRAFEKAGIKFRTFGSRIVSLKSLLKYLGKQGVLSVFVEGGGKIHGGFVDGKLVDKVIFYIAPMIIGDHEAFDVISGTGFSSLKKALRLKDLDVVKVGEDLKVSGEVNFY